MITSKTDEASYAQSYVDAGVSVIPLRLDGSKAPALPRGRVNEFKERKPTSDELQSWFSQPAGIGLIAGPVSGGLEILDFDGDAERIFPQWESMVTDILVWLPVVETPSLGFHVLYRCGEVSGSHKIACDPTSEKQTLIESRGYGGYVVGCGSPLSVHSIDMPYAQVSGPPMPEIPTISREDRRQLWSAARTFDKSEIREKAIAKLINRMRPKKLRLGDDLTPWDDFDRRGDWIGLLQQYGWASYDGVHWTRPGKSSGTSATLRQVESGEVYVLHVFSSSTPLEPAKSHSLFTVYATYEHNGDKSRAAKELLKKGYGGRA